MTAYLRSKHVLVFIVGTSAALVSAVSAACGSSAPPVESGDDGLEASTPDVIVLPDANGNGGHDGAAGDSSKPSDAGDASTIADAHGGLDAADAADVIVPPVCDPDAGGTLGPGTLVLATTDPSILGALTPDELVMAWTTIPADGGAVVVSWAERASPNDAFGAPQSLDPNFGPFAADHVNISGDGLKLAFVTPNQLSIVEVARPARGTSFVNVTTSEDFLGEDPSGSGPESVPGLGPFGSSALSPDFKRWGFIKGNLGFMVDEVQAGTWSQAAFPSGILPPAESRIRIQPTGWSSDDLTFFYWDQAALVARMTWVDRNSSTIAFVSSVNLGSTAEWIYPSGDCSSFYYSPPAEDGGVGSLGIYVAQQQ